MAKPKYSKEYNETSNRSVYNKARKFLLEKQGKIYCDRCSYHRGDNDKNHYYAIYENVPDNRTDRRFNRRPSWKLVCKNKKQWMTKKYKLKSRIHYFYNCEYFEIII